MIDKNVHIIGCSPQAEYVVDILFQSDVAVDGIFDPIGKRVGKSINKYKIRQYEDFEALLRTPQNQPLCAIICLAENRLKEEIFQTIKNGACFINAVHTGSHIAHSVKLGTGNIINAGAVIQPNAVIGNGCMIHAGVVVEHDNVICDFVNIAPGVILAGGVRVGERTTINTGTVIAPNVKVGSDCVVGAGSLILKDVPDNVTVYGRPAKIIKHLND